MKIGIDIDDTLAATTQYLLNEINNYHKNVLKRPFVYNESADNIYDKYGCTKKEAMLFLRYFKKNRLLLKFPLIKDASKVVNKLGKTNKIIIITSRNYLLGLNMRYLTKKWLINNDISFDRLIVNKKLKGSICHKKKIDLFIDDSLKQCENVSKYGIKVILFSSKEKDKCDHFKRINTWEEIYKEVGE